MEPTNEIEASADGLRTLFGQMLNAVDDSPLPQVRIHIRLGEFAGTALSDRAGNFECTLDEPSKPSELDVAIFAPDGKRLELIEKPVASGDYLLLRTKVEPIGLSPKEWKQLRKLLGGSVPNSVAGLARELASPASFDLARVPLADRLAFLREAELALLDPEGVLASYFDAREISFDAFRNPRRDQAEWLADVLANQKEPVKEAAQVRLALAQAKQVATRAPLLEIQTPLSKVGELGRFFPERDELALATRERWTEVVERLGLREDVEKFVAPEFRDDPRAWLRATAKKPYDPEKLDKSERRLHLVANLTSIGATPVAAAALVAGGVQSLHQVARLDTRTVADMLGGPEPFADARQLKIRARQAMAITRGRLVEVALATGPSTGFLNIYANGDVATAGSLIPSLQPQVVQDACEPCENCVSALSPGAYLVDLLDFFADCFNWTLPQIETRFTQLFGNWPLDCEAVEKKQLQIWFSNEVLARFIRARRGLDWRSLDAASIDQLYDEFRALTGADVYPTVLFDTYDAYRQELRADPAAITQAMNNAATRAAMALQLGLDEADLPALILAANAVRRSSVTQVASLLLKSKTKKTLSLLEENLRAQTYATRREELVGALDPQAANYDALVQAAEAQATNDANAAVNTARPALSEQAESEAGDYTSTVVRRLDKSLLPRCRDNLIYIALQAIRANPVQGRTLTDARTLGDYLCVDLQAGDCLETTRVAFAIETLQTFVQGYLLGREGVLSASFDTPRWRWMRSFGLWAAAQAVFLYPENFLSPQFRTRNTEAFSRMVEKFELSVPSRSAAREALLSYSQEMRDFAGNGVRRLVQVGDKLYALCIGSLSRSLYCSSLDVSGTWSGWRRIEGLQGEIRPALIPTPDIQDVVVMKDQIFVVCRGPAPEFKLFAFRFNPEESEGISIDLVPDNVRRARAVAIDTPFRQVVAFFVQRFTTGTAELQEYEVFLLGPSDQTATAWEKKIYMPLGAVKFSLRAVSTHVLPTDALGANPVVIFSCLANSGTNRLRSYVVPSGLIGPSQVGSGDVILGSFPNFAIDVGTADVSALNVISLGHSSTRPNGSNQLIVAVQPLSNSGWSVHLVDSVGTAPTVIKSLQSSSNAVPPVLQGSYLGGAGGFNENVFIGTGSWLARVPGAGDDWNNVNSWRPTGQIFLGTEGQSGSLRMDLDALKSAASLPAFRALQLAHWDFMRSGGYARRYVEELFLHVPLWLAARMNEEERHDVARELMELVFRPFGSGLSSPFLYEGILREQAQTQPGFDYRSTVEYLRNPFDPHAIAGLRPMTYARYVVQAYVDNQIDWADAEFTRDSPESVAAARELYEGASDILGLSSVPKDLCASGFATLMISVLKALPSNTLNAWRTLLSRIWSELQRIGSAKAVQAIIAQIENILTQQISDAEKRAALKRMLEELRAQEGQSGRTLNQVLEQRTDSRKEMITGWGAGHLAVMDRFDELPLDLINPVVPAQYLDYGFCIPRNDVFEALRFRIESNLDKIRSCRNIAGIRRSLEAYAVAQDPTALVQAATAGGGEIEDFIPVEPPPMFRYSYLWERARQAATTAQHLEAYLLASFEKADAAAYTLFQAKNDLKMANENVALQAVRVREAGQGVALAQAQRDKARYSGDHFRQLMNAGENSMEQTALLLMRIASFLPSSLSVSVGATGPSVSIGYSPSGILQNEASILNTRASYLRRAEEWSYQIGLSGWDERIAEAQIDSAGIQVEIANRELETAGISVQLAGQTIEFLNEQFTGVELYKWMIKELRKLYRQQLSLAVGLGRACQQALAFELQEPLNFVGTQYWETKREGLLGAEKLAVDLERLDGHRIGKAERRRELTKSLSLATLLPSEFQELRRTGLLTFATLMSWFDRDHPGHYMRLIKSVEFSVFALTPPLGGIHANVSHHGMSRVMVGPPFAIPTILQRAPETISLSAARADSGLFQLRLDDPMLLPFEGSGVDTTWTLELAKGANNFNFDTLVDVVMTVRYTAKEDYGYRQRVVADLENEMRSIATFSARQTFADAWFHLHNPMFRQNPADYGFGAGQVRPPYTMRFELGRHHFPANEAGITLRRLVVASAQEIPTRIPIRIEFLPTGALAPLTADAEIDGGTVSLGVFANRPPFGTWTLKLRSDAPPANYPEFFVGSSQTLGQTRLALDGLRDLALLMDYSARVSYPRA